MSTDPVALLNGKLVEGKAEFPVSYASRIFLFANEKNQKEFIATPRKFLKEKPKMPSTYNIALLGPQCSGKQTLSRLLAKRYGWKVINFCELLAETVKSQIGCDHIPCNPDGGKIHLSEVELKKFLKGEGFPMHHLWPVVAD